MARTSFKPRRLLLVHAHPDDESLSTAHVIAETLRSGGEVLVLTLTRGERGKVKLEELKSLEGNLHSMGAFRANELANAIAEFAKLGPIRQKFAGTRSYLDSGARVNRFGRLIKLRPLDELSLAAAGASVIADDIIATIKEFKPDTVVTYNSNGGSGHPDHKAAYAGTALALRKLKRARGRVPKLWVISEPRQRAEVKVGSAASAAVKKAALEAHQSQVAVFADTYSVVSGFETRYDAPDRLRSSSPGVWHQFRPFFAALWAVPLGALLGLAGTLLHNITGMNGQLPLGLIVALTMVFSLGIAMRVLRNSRGALNAMGAAFTATIIFLAQRQSGGGALIFATTIGEVWTFGSIGTLALIAVFPRLKPGTWRKSASGLG
jgi:N-acetyl-1-D-myo-inositol-2-amino-2-deoxy-alpha-D-glucopyranoside deacetylase